VPESQAILNGFVTAGHRSLDALSQAIDPAAFERAVETFAKAQTIFLIAKRRSYPITSYMAYAFGKLRVKCIAVGTAAGIDDDVLALAGPHDAAFAVSFSPYASETAGQARTMAGRGVPVVSLTDSAFSPLAEVSSVWFEVVEADHAGFRSLSASMAFAMALTVSVAEARRHRSG
jgi:DNA-binding MurR/RpiR family transcriptional regulator